MAESTGNTVDSSSLEDIEVITSAPATGNILAPVDNITWTDKEKSAIKQFRKHPTAAPWIQEKHSDEYLLRFLRARDLDLKNSTAMFAKSMEWRKDRDIDHVVERILKRKYYNVTRDVFTTTPDWDVRTKDGFLAAFTRVGSLVPKSVLNFFPMEYILDYHLYEMETVERRREALRKEKGYSAGVIVVHDLSGLNWSHAYTPALDAVKRIAALDADNYPEFVRGMFIVNAPKVFTAVWAILKPAVDKNTLKKVRIYGHTGWQKDLEQVFHKKDLPDFLGGENDSSKWIGTGGEIDVAPKSLGRDAQDDIEDQRETVTIKAKGVFHKDIKVDKPGSTLFWEYTTRNPQLALSILYNDGSQKKAKWETIREATQAKKSQDFVMKRLKVDKPGTYRLCIDNQHSHFRSKTMIYRYCVIDP